MPMQAQLIITVTEQGEVSVTGPIANRMLCYSMLEMARDVVRDLAPKADQTPDAPRIMPAEPAAVSQLTRRFGA